MNTKRHFSLIFLISIALGLSACQQPLEAPGYTDSEEISQGDTIINNLCDDGTTDCIVEVQGPIHTSMDSFLLSMYDQCLLTAASIAQCNNIPETFIQSDPDSLSSMDLLASAENLSCSENALFGLCQEEVYGDGGESYASDDFTIEEGSLVLEVKIEMCIDNYNRSALIFNGETASLKHYTKNDTLFNHPVSFRVCGSQTLYDKTKVKFTPHTGTNYSVGGLDFKTTPFTGDGAKTISKTHRDFEIIPFGIPKAYRDQVNLGKSKWLLKRAGVSLFNTQLANSSSEDNTFIKTQFVSKSRDLNFPLTYVRITPPLEAQFWDLHMIFIAPPLDK